MNKLKTDKVFFNQDWMHFWITRYQRRIRVNEKVLKDFICQYKDTNITDFCINVNGSTSSTPTVYLDTWGSKYLKKTENGIDVDYTNTFASLWYDVHVTQGLDACQIWIDTLYEIGINPWISVRMNDCHHNAEKATLLKAEEIENHPEWWIARHRNGKSYYDKCLDFSIKEVRNRILGYINEQLERYDVYGLELDFTREPYCFPYGKQDCEIMMSFMRDVKSIVNNISNKRKKEIKISILCQANPVNAYHNGFDVFSMAEESLIDVVVASPRWKTINTDIPIELWKKALSKNVEFGCMQQLLVSAYQFGEQHTSNVSMAFGQATANLSRGADFIYLYNYMDLPILEDNSCEIFDTSIRKPENLSVILNNIGVSENRDKYPRRHPVTFDDFVNGYELMQSILPLRIAGISCIRIPTGKINGVKKVYFIINTEEPIDVNEITIYLNTIKGTIVNERKEDTNIVQGNVYCFGADITAKTQVSVEILTKKVVVIKYAEILVE